MLERVIVQVMGWASMAATKATSRGSSGKNEALDFPDWVQMMVDPFISTVMFMEAPLLKITKPRPPRKSTILFTDDSPLQVPERLSKVGAPTAPWGAVLLEAIPDDELEILANN